uniref:KH-like RNA-binding domain-containing protein n=1 Tax=Jaculus jaculus TaxID=51337 RepID=A0A8C5KD72_JACJA
MRTLRNAAWWTLPEHFDTPLEECVFGHGDPYLHGIEVHSHTLIQREKRFTDSGHTLVGTLRARQWLLDMMRNKW